MAEQIEECETFTEHPPSPTSPDILTHDDDTEVKLQDSKSVSIKRQVPTEDNKEKKKKQI